jgi:hypothetical protein
VVGKEKGRGIKHLTDGFRMSYESRGFKVGGIAGVESKINSPQKLDEPLLSKVGG